jgi:L-asparaginase
MNRAAIVFTGGTISMETDVTRGGHVPTLDGEAILARTPGLAEIAEVVAIDRGLTPASHFTFPGLLDLAGAVREALADPGTDGVVVVQGTDTIEETSFLLDLVLDSPKPVIVTGAMRAASDPGYDGPANLRTAVRCACAPELRGEGVLVVLAGSIDAADDVTKTHATALDTFRSLNLGPVGRVEEDRVIVSRRRGPRRRVSAGSAAERVHLVTAHVAMDGSLIDAAVAAGADGLVVEATGAGNTSLPLLEAARRGMGTGLPVVLTTRCPAGAAGSAYAFPGGGATWVQAGALTAGFLGGPKARVALALGLGAGLDRAALMELLAGPAADPGAPREPERAAWPPLG